MSTSILLRDASLFSQLPFFCCQPINSSSLYDIEMIVITNCIVYHLNMRITELHQLSCLVICSDCLSTCIEFSVQQCSVLRSITIYDNCFNTKDGLTFAINSCKELQSITIGENSFTHFSTFEMKSNPTLFLLNRFTKSAYCLYCCR